MNTKNMRVLGAFALCTFAELLGEITGDRQLILYSKPLLMPLLGVWLFLETRHFAPQFRNIMLLGLVFATLGDTLLLFSSGPAGGIYFLLGLGAFLCMQLCYIAFFTRFAGFKEGYLKQKPLHFAAYLAYLAVLLLLLWPGIPAPMKIPVAIYAAVLTTMGLSAHNLRGAISGDAAMMTFYGSLLFIASDSILAINKFGLAFDDANIGIMVTYIAGQWLIVSGAAVLVKERKDS